MNTSRRRVEWSDLPNELLTIIGERLDTRIDVLRLRAVCKFWRSTFTLSPKNYIRFPVKLPDLNEYLNYCRLFFGLTETTLYRLELSDWDGNSYSSESPREWLVKIDEWQPGKICLLNPLSHHQIRYDPERFPKSLNVLDYRVFELSKSYNVEYLYGNFRVSFGKAIFSAIDSSVLVKYEYQGGKLAFLRLGDEKWTQLDFFDSADIILYKGKYYAIDMQGQVVVIDSLTLKITKISHPLVTGSKKKFVQCSGDLCVFSCTYPRVDEVMNYDENEDCYYFKGGRTVGFEIYKLNEAECDWVEVKSLVDVAVVVSEAYSFSVSAEQLGCQGNCIYFYGMMNLCFYWEGDDAFQALNGRDIGVFNLGDCSIRRLASKYLQAILPPPTWFKTN